MSTSRPTDEDLMAYADGALPAERAAELAILIAADARLRARVEMFRSSRAAVKRAVGPLAEAAVPEALRRAVEAKIAAAGGGNTVVPFPKAAHQRSAGQWTLPLAASFAALAAGLAGYGLGSGGGSAPARQFAVNAPIETELAGLLSRQASGTESAAAAGRVRTIASFKGRGNLLCREFEVDAKSGDTVMGLACRDEGVWRLRIAVAAPPASDGYAPASSLTAIDSYLDAVEAGEPLSADAERSALAN